MVASREMGLVVNFTLEHGGSGLFMIHECHSPFISSVSFDTISFIRRGRERRLLFRLDVMMRFGQLKGRP